jgi:hypothetical protein
MGGTYNESRIKFYMRSFMHSNVHTPSIKGVTLGLGPTCPPYHGLSSRRKLLEGGRRKSHDNLPTAV